MSLIDNGRTCYAIAKMLREEKFPKRDGSLFTARNVSLIVENYPKHQILREP